jgi:hypothetical protein
MVLPDCDEFREGAVAPTKDLVPDIELLDTAAPGLNDPCDLQPGNALLRRLESIRRAGDVGLATSDQPVALGHRRGADPN